MATFGRVLFAEAYKQHRNYFHSPLVYFSVLLWPMLEIATAYYMYQPFTAEELNSAILANNVGSVSITGFLLIGFLGYNFFFCLIQSAWRFTYERTDGTLELIMLTPANRFAVILGNAAAALVESMWLLTFFLIIWLYGFSDSSQSISIWLLALGIFALVLAAVAWGTLLNSFFLMTRDAGLFYTIMQDPLSFFSGVRFPITVFASWLQTISYLFPLTYCLMILREITLNQAPFGVLIPSLLRLAGLIGLMLAASSILIDYAERRAKRAGTFTLF